MAGVLKGTLVVGQSGGPTAVINCSLAGVIEEATKHAEIENVYGLVHGIEGALNENLINLKKVNAGILQGLRNTPAAALGSCRYKLKSEDYDRIINGFQAHNVRYFVYIGGNDSMDTCHRIAMLAAEQGYEMRVMGVPKTIDNDLVLTDHCPGYGSAARFIALAAQDTGRDLEAMETFDKITILETMGRNTGWLAAASVLGKREQKDPPHLVYVPERPFDEKDFLTKLERIHKEQGHVFVVVCEGIRDRNGKFVGVSSSAIREDAFGHPLVSLTSGVAHYLAELVRSQLGLQTRHIKPDTIQRSFMACVSKTDQQEAYLVGKMAVAYAVEGKTDGMVALLREPGSDYRCTTDLVPLVKVANARKQLPGQFIAKEGNFISKAFWDYALPLLGDPLPQYVRLT